jgi:hypothetical protein
MELVDLPGDAFGRRRLTSEVVMIERIMIVLAAGSSTAC